MVISAEVGDADLQTEVDPGVDLQDVGDTLVPEAELGDQRGGVEDPQLGEDEGLAQEATHGADTTGMGP